jgi:RNA polymerase sigma factor (sigma-70 family)
MKDIKPFLPQPGMDERAIAKEMIHDKHSRHWETCITFLNHWVHAKAKNIPDNLQEDIVQEVMYRVAKYLPHFRFQCALKTWLYQIIESCTIDVYRRLQHESPYQTPLVDPLNEYDREDESSTKSEEKSAEDAFMINDEIQKGSEALLEYTNIHSNPTRDRLIIRMVIGEGHTHTEAAIAVGCNAPVVGYVVREAQRYAREKREHKP